MSPARIAVDRIGHGYFVAALAEFYASGRYGTLHHSEDRAPEESSEAATAATDGRDPDASSAGSSDRARDPDVDGPALLADRRDAGPNLVRGRPNEVTLSVYGTVPVLLRDRVPDGWRVVDGDAHATTTDGDATYVEFAHPIASGTRTYVAVPPADTTARTVDVGPLEYSADGGETWRAVAETASRHVVPGPRG